MKSHPAWKLLAVAAAFASSSVFADVASGTVGTTVDPINTVTFTAAAFSTVKLVASAGNSAYVLGSGRIDNNNALGWKLSVISANNGTLRRGGNETGTGREVTYTNITLRNTGGTLGTNLTDPKDEVRNVTTSVATPVIFSTRTTKDGTGTARAAHSATVAYTYSLEINIPALSEAEQLLSGDYKDTISLTLVNDV
jgi:hypothetical protein